MMMNQIIPCLRGTATGGGRCCGAVLPGRFEDRGGGAGLLFADLGGRLWSFVGVCVVARLNSGGDCARLGCGNTSGKGGGGLG